MLSNHYYSVMSGLMASLGSFFGKLTTFGETESSLLQKGVCITLMLISNAMVWRYFVKGLHSNDSLSTLVPTVISTAANFIISGILGKLVFSESTNLMWCVGAALILLGLYCIISEEERDKDKNKRS